jgi:hypothetical protein
MLLALALAGLGVAYGLWSHTLVINGTVNTGNVDTRFTKSFTDDDNKVDEAALDFYDKGNCPIGSGSCDPKEAGPEPQSNTQHRSDKGFGVCTATISVDGNTGTITLNNSYPAYYCTSWFDVKNTGSIPVKVARIIVNGLPVLPGVATSFDLNNADGDNNNGTGADVAIRIGAIDQCQQIEPGQTVRLYVAQNVLDAAPENASLSYIIRLQFNQWNAECNQASLPGFVVTSAGLSGGQASALAGALGIPADKLVVADGAALFIDPQRFQAVPMRAADDPGLGQGEDDQPAALEAFDFDALKRLKALDGKAALARFGEALSSANAVPQYGAPIAQHSLFEAVDANGKPMLEAVKLDTHVNYRFSLEGVPLIGPGALVNVAYAPDGQVSALNYAARGLSKGAELPIIPLSDAQQACVRALLGQAPGVDLAAAAGDGGLQTQLVYYAPPLSIQGVQMILPHYDCGGTINVNGQPVEMLHVLVPAAQDAKLTPAVSLKAQYKDGQITARATVQGGMGPYSYEWTSALADLGQFKDQAEIAYTPRQTNRGPADILKVMVTDANGVQVQATQIVQLPPPGDVITSESLEQPLVAGIRDYGVERAVSNLGAGNQAGFVNRFNADGVTQRFNWTGTNAWEDDFKQPLAGHDTDWIDNTDITFYIGHGWGGGFTFEDTTHDDTDLTFTDAVGAWGNHDLEWLSLLSCRVLVDNYNGLSHFQRWGPAFDGLHLLTGFHTLAWDWPAFGGRYADWMLGRTILFWHLPPLPVRAAWFQAAREEQPSGTQSVVMGVIGPNGLSNYNDYFHGKGPVGPDLRGANKLGYWSVRITTP